MVLPVISPRMNILPPCNVLLEPTPLTNALVKFLGLIAQYLFRVHGRIPSWVLNITSRRGVNRLPAVYHISPFVRHSRVATGNCPRATAATTSGAKWAMVKQSNY